MTLLVTGSQGHIGRHLVATLRSAGKSVRTFDRPGSREPDHAVGDLRDLRDVRRAMHGVSAVAHLGAISDDMEGFAEEVLTVNVQGVWNVLLAAVEAGVERVVFFSSVNALGAFGGRRPAAFLPLADDYPRHPLTPYQLSKHLGEEICRSFSNLHGIVTLCLRPMFVSTSDHYRRWKTSDEAQRERWGRGDYWAYVDVRDVCSAVLLALDARDVLHDAFLLSAADTTMSTPTTGLLDRHYADTPWPGESKSEYFRANPRRSVIDCSRAEKVLGWRPQHSWLDAE